MQGRVDQEIEMLGARFADLEYRVDGKWIRIPKYPLPSGWGVSETQLAFAIPVQYPGGPPYGIYVPVGLRFEGKLPGSYSEPAPTQPPFGGVWGFFSWTTADGVWRSTEDPIRGSNLLNWVLGFRQRLEEGA
jgi:hypothetical protein